MPISSDLPPSSGWAVVPEPFASTVRPSARASAIVSLSFSMVAGFTSATVSTSKFQLIVPTRPSWESGDSAWAFAFAVAASPPDCWTALIICFCWAAAASTGLAGAGLAWSLPSGICGSAESSLTRLSTAALCWLSASCSPFGAATTTFTEAWSKASAEPGNSSDWRAAARSDGMPGIENASLIGLDSVPATVATPIMATSHAAMNIGQRR